MANSLIKQGLVSTLRAMCDLFETLVQGLSVAHEEKMC